ncbi:alpha-amylase [Gardnerella sp. KA00718]|uniref:alpha-amylase family glycosyl hydrolase n=1 Tax=Gardnerella sp. KA00718 TaxID=2749077 RepID=UPI003BAAC725
MQNEHAQWLRDAVFYEIYPQSFYDSNGDGIGDIPGIIEKLDYVKSLGCNAIWLNPCYDSPFKDAGYDVRDYKKVAARYGTNEDLQRLFSEAHNRGMHILLDLVPGHTSEEHEWFKQSSRAQENEFSKRYIWTDSAFSGYSMPFIGGESERDATYILNFFKCQPALNYGFAQRDRAWQSAPDSNEAAQTRAAMVDVMRFWLALGADGFRVDMADSLVKNDDNNGEGSLGKDNTIRAWQEMLGAVKAEYPQAAFVSEWGRPRQALAAGFDMDFYLNWRWDGQPNGYAHLARDVDNALDGNPERDHSYFNARGGGSICPFLDDYCPQYEATCNEGYFSFITCNHDTPRLAPRLSDRERRIAFGMILTMPGVPFVYYGDEIGMKYRDIPTKEGGYARTGTRTPMQWDDSKNFGFSTAAKSKLYLPVEARADGRTCVNSRKQAVQSGEIPTVLGQEQDGDSLLNWVRALIALRHECAALHADATWRVLHAPVDGRSFAYERCAAESNVSDGESSTDRCIVVMNPGLNEETIALSALAGLTPEAILQPRISVGAVACDSSALKLGAQSFAAFRLA